jgi:predicted NAD-dependent protein-ADP-ribosyltransferase YbiA (DUF1768 family)
MQSDKIYFFNPYDKPFGALSNLYPLENFKVDEEKYKNINNYVYNFFGCNASERQIISSTSKQSEIRDLSLSFRNKCSEEVKVNSLQDAYSSAFKNPNLRLKLIETGNKKLLFDDSDPLLGIGEDGRGKNVVGKILMRLRSQIKIEDREKIKELERLKDHNIKYDSYIAYNGLKRIMFDEKNLLDEFKDLSVSDIINKVGREKLMLGGMSKEAFISLTENLEKQRDELIFQKDKIKDKESEKYLNIESDIKKIDNQIKNKIPKEVKELIQDDKAVYNLLRKRYLFNLREQILEDLSLDLLIEYMQSKEMLNDLVDWDFDYYTFISKNRDQFIELEDRLIILYNLGVNEDLMKQALNSYNKRNNTNVRIPALNEVIKSESNEETEDVDIFLSDAEDNNIEILKNQIEQDKPDDNSVLNFGSLEDENTSFLSPYYYYSYPVGNEGERRYVPIKIEGLFYPTPLHYMIVSLLGLISMFYTDKKDIDYHLRLRAGINQSYPLILVNRNLSKLDPYNFISDFEYLYNLVRTNYLKAVDEVMRYRLEKALSIKFEIDEFKLVLRQTGNKVLIYDDKNDPILGGDRNMVGEVLMMLRQRLDVVEIVQEEIKIKKVSLKDVTKGNKDLENWIKMRTTDIITSIKEVVNYLSSLDSISTKVIASPELIEFVINELYTPCKKMELDIEEIVNVPRDFYDSVFSSLKGISIGPKGVTLIWQYIDNILQSALSLGDNNPENTMVILNGIQFINPNLNCFKSSDVKVIKKIFNNLQVCSLTAVSNILKKMQGYIVSKYKDFTYSSGDIDFAFRMLYNFPKNNIKDNIKDLDVSVNVTGMDNKIFNLIKTLKLEDDYSKYIKDAYKIAEKVLELNKDTTLKDIINKKDSESLEEYLNTSKEEIKLKKTQQEIIRKIEDEFDTVLTSSYLPKSEKDLIIKKVIFYTSELFEASKNKKDEQIIQSRINLFI